MRVAILSESPADEAAVRILVEAVLEHPIEPVEIRFRKAGGIDAVLSVLAPALKWLHYRREAEGLVVVVDSNSTPTHTGALDQPCNRADTCRLCRVRGIIAGVNDSLSPMPSLGPVKTAVGLAVPAIEAWYLCGENPNVSEKAWDRALRERRFPYTREDLKREVYGSDRYGIALETKCAAREMRRVVADLAQLERKFPQGFGSLLSNLREW